MREIKFRHYDTRYNEMRYSDIHDGEFYVNLKGVMYMYAIPKYESGLETKYYKSYDIMQFTGLKDKNGKDIYEGDILKHKVISNPKQMGKVFHNQVEYYNGSVCGWRIRNKSFHMKLTENWLYNQEAVIVGNIHETPDLL